MASQRHEPAVAYGGFFINFFEHLQDLEGAVFQVTKEDLLEYINTCYEGIGKCPSTVIVKKIEERGYRACSDGKAVLLGVLDINENVVGYAHLPFAMSVQRWLYELFPNRKDGAGVMWREYDSKQADKIVNHEPVILKIIDGVLFRVSDPDVRLTAIPKDAIIHYPDGDISFPDNYFDD